MESENANVTKKDLAPYEFKVPLKRLVKPKKVLSEDEFSQTISKIIERDFFPDLPKLEAQAEYYEALEKNDLVKLREIQMRFKRPDTGCSDVSNTPSTFETPAEIRRKTTPSKRKQINKSQLQEDGSNSEQDDIQEAMENIEEDSSAPRIKLDAFLAKNTSEDSASFAEILKESERKHRIKYAWIFEKEKEQLAEHEDMIALPPIEEQAAIKDRPAHVNSWKYTNENAVMYVPEATAYEGIVWLALMLGTLLELDGLRDALLTMRTRPSLKLMTLCTPAESSTTASLFEFPWQPNRI